MKKFFCLLSCAFCLFATACGFTPLYANHGAHAVSPQLANVYVDTIPDQIGQNFRNNLLDRMPPAAAQPRYELRVIMNESGFGVAIAKDATVTRQELRDNIHAELYDRQTQKIVWRQDSAATAGFNVLESQYSNMISQQDAQKRNLDDLADRLVNQIALYFDRPAS